MRQYAELVKSKAVLEEAERWLALAISSAAFTRVSVDALRKQADLITKRLAPGLISLLGAIHDGFTVDDAAGAAWSAEELHVSAAETNAKLVEVLPYDLNCF